MERGKKRAQTLKRGKEILEFTVRSQKGQEQIAAHSGHRITSLCANKKAVRNKPGGTGCLNAKKSKRFNWHKRNFLGIHTAEILM